MSVIGALFALVVESSQFSSIQGVEVVQVVAGSVAEKAGVRKGDVITAWGTRRPVTPTGLRLAIRNTTGRGLISVKMVGRSVSLDPETLGGFPKSPASFGVHTIPSLSGKSREMTLKAWEIFDTDRSGSAKLLSAAAEEELQKGRATQGIWLSLAAARTEGGDRFHARILELTKQLNLVNDASLRAEILNDRYWSDPKVSMDPKQPDHRFWWYQTIDALEKGGYPISAAILMGFHGTGYPFDYVQSEKIALRRRALALLEDERGAEALKAPLLRNLGWETHVYEGGSSLRTAAGKSAYLAAAMVYESLGDKRVQITPLGDLSWNIRTDVTDASLVSERSFSAVQGQAGALALAALAAFHQYHYTEAEELALKAVRIRDSIGSDIPWDLASYDSHIIPIYVLALTSLVRGDLDSSIAWHSEYKRLNLTNAVTDDQIRLGQLMFRKDPGGQSLAEQVIKRNQWNSKIGDWDIAVPYLVGLLIKQKRGQEALTYLEPALRRWRGAFRSMWIPQGFISLGDVKRSLGDSTGALEAYEGAVMAAQNSPRANPYTIRALSRWGSLVSDQAKYPEAQKALEEALSLSLLFASQAKGELSRQFAASIVSEVSAALVQHYERSGQSIKALETLENSRGRSLAALMASSRDNEDSAVWQAYKEAARVFEAVENEIIAEEQKIRQAEIEAQSAAGVTQSLKGLGVSLDFSPDPSAFLKEAAASKQKVMQLRSKRALARLDLEKTSAAALESARGKRPLFSAQSFLQGLPSGRVFVTFCAGPTEVIVIAGSKEAGIKSSPVSLKGEALEDWTARIVKPFSNPAASMEAVDAVAKEGFSTLFPGEIASLIGGAKELLIVPEGDLWTLPFAALKNGKGAWLGSSLPITYALSLTVSQGGEAVSAGTGAVVVGDPIFSRGGSAAGQSVNQEATRLWSGSDPPPPLPATKLEAEEVAKLYKATPLIGEGATESNLRRSIEQARIIHLATHGYISAEFPLASGVLLTAPRSITDASDDGVLQAAEIARRMRLKADLVVLSACETGRGLLLQGEGVQGLVRSLTLAGARSVVASQWKVADESTKELMVRFHTSFAKSGSSAQSLMEAMRHSMVKRPHPYYWAPFAAYGSL